MTCTNPFGVATRALFFGRIPRHGAQQNISSVISSRKRTVLWHVLSGSQCPKSSSTLASRSESSARGVLSAHSQAHCSLASQNPSVISQSSRYLHGHLITPQTSTSASTIDPATATTTATTTIVTPPKQPYHVHRTGTHNLPVYQSSKAGGSLKQTSIRKISGNPTRLAGELLSQLQPRPLEVKVNPTNGHVVIKGWYKEEVIQFLKAKGF